MQRPFTASRFLLAALPLLVTGCGGANSTGNGLFGGGNSGTSGGTTQTSSPAASPVASVASGNLQPNAAPLDRQSGAASMGGGTGPTAATAEAPNGPLAPLAGAYTGTWAAALKPAPAGDASSGKNASASSGPLTLKIAYPSHASKTVLGDLSGTWTDAAIGGVGRISGTIDRIGLPHEPNAVHVVGSVRFPGGKSVPLVVELSEDAVGHLAGATDADTISLKKSR